jgi:RNA polymerase sigma-70 factor (ECF subfamily)
LGETDQALVDRCRAGDRSAFEEVVRQTARGLFARLYLQTGDPHRAEDLCQETYLAAWRSIGQLKDAKRLRPWLDTVARSVLVDAARRELRRKRGGNQKAARPGQSGNGAAEMDRAPDRYPSPLEAAGQAELRQRALATLRSLPEEYRLPLALRYLAGADYESIARELALSNGSLRGLLSRGLALLRQRLGDVVPVGQVGRTVRSAPDNPGNPIDSLLGEGSVPE